MVTFDTGVLVQNYVKLADWDWPLLIDHERKLYDAYSMQRGSWWSIYNPWSICEYLKLVATGNLPGKPGDDQRQFGGDVLIDPQHDVRMHFTSQSPHDRPSPDSILSIVGST